MPRSGLRAPGAIGPTLPWPSVAVEGKRPIAVEPSIAAPVNAGAMVEGVHRRLAGPPIARPSSSFRAGRARARGRSGQAPALGGGCMFGVFPRSWSEILWVCNSFGETSPGTSGSIRLTECGYRRPADPPTNAAVGDRLLARKRLCVARTDGFRGFQAVPRRRVRPWADLRRPTPQPRNG
jgi:hypothetical protein